MNFCFFIKSEFPKKHENFRSSYYAYFTDKYQKNSVCTEQKILDFLKICHFPQKKGGFI